MCLFYFSKLQRMTYNRFYLQDKINVEVNKNRNKIIQAWFKGCIKRIEKLQYVNFLSLDILDWFILSRQRYFIDDIFRQNYARNFPNWSPSIELGWRTTDVETQDSKFDSLSRALFRQKGDCREDYNFRLRRRNLHRDLHGLRQHMQSAAFLSRRVNYNQDWIAILSDTQHNTVMTYCLRKAKVPKRSYGLCWLRSKIL